MSSTDSNASEAEDEGAPDAQVQLHEAIINLQRSFSRVSRDTAKQSLENPDKALAYVIGNVNFSLSLNVRMEKDTIVIDEASDSCLSLDGTIRCDIRSVDESEWVEAEEASDAEGDKEKPSNSGD